MTNPDNSPAQMPGQLPPRPDIVCVLAGGESRRFGRSKLLVHVRGVPVLAWLRARLGAWQPNHIPCRFWLSLPFGNTPVPPGADGYDRIIRDPLPFQGPLAGIAAVLNAAAGLPHGNSGTPAQTQPTTLSDPAKSHVPVIAFVTGDMPCLLPEQLTMLLSALRDTPGAARSCFETTTLPSDPTGAPGLQTQPLPMLMDLATAQSHVADGMRKGMRGPMGLARRDDCVRVPLIGEEANALLNINTPLDLAPIESLLGSTVEAR